MSLYFIHGAGNTAQVWDAQLRRFPDATAVALPGHPDGRGMDSVADYAEWLRARIAERGDRAPILAGHSMGGGIALQYAVQHPEELAALILISTGARLRVNPRIFAELDRGLEALTDFVLSWTFSAHASPDLVARTRAERLAVSAETVRGDFLACDRFDAMAELGRILAPTLILCGAEDVMTPSKYAEFLHAQIKGSVLRIIPEAGHMVMLEQPEGLNEAIVEFLATIAA